MAHDDYREIGPEAIHASRLEEAAMDVLAENRLSPADRAVLENAVRIARTLKKGMRAAG